MCSDVAEKARVQLKLQEPDKSLKKEFCSILLGSRSTWRFRSASEQNSKLQVLQVGILNMYLASGCMGKVGSPVSVLRSNSERSDKTLIAEEGKARVSLLSSKNTGILS